MHSASSGKFVLVTVHAKRGTEGMDAAGVLPGFAGIACHDAWAPYDSYDARRPCSVQCAPAPRADRGHRDRHRRRRDLGQQAIDALLALKKAADAARAQGPAPSTRRSWKSTAAGSARQPLPGSS